MMEYLGEYTRERCPDALYENDSRVMKCNSEPGDTHPNGSLGTVIGSVDADGLVGYFVAWDAHPDLAIFTAEPKLVPLR